MHNPESGGFETGGENLYSTGLGVFPPFKQPISSTIDFLISLKLELLFYIVKWRNGAACCGLPNSMHEMGNCDSLSDKPMILQAIVARLMEK